jgi:hypothetical protein
MSGDPFCHELGQDFVFGWPVQDIQGHDGTQDSGADLDGREVATDQKDAAPARERTAKVIEALDLRERSHALVVTPPGQRGFADTDTEALKVASEKGLACVGGELRQAQLDVPLRDADLGERQQAHKASEEPADHQLRRVGQGLDEAKQADAEPGRPVSGRKPARLA